MANFGFAQLAVVAPYEPKWREARSAVGVPELLLNANQSATLADAVSDCTLVIGTGTLTHRKPEQSVVPLPSLAPVVRRHLDSGGRVALVFGSEKRGLTRDDLSYCHLFTEIPTSPRQPSMNLGQAVAVCLYELASRAFSPAEPAAAPPEDIQLASGARLDLVAAAVEQAMEAADYSPAGMREANRHDLRLLLRRLTLTERDARRILGLFRRIVWHLKHPGHSA